MDKSGLREEYKLRRSQLSSSDIKSYSEKIFTLIKSHFTLDNKTVHIFLPISKFNEINTMSFIEFLFELKCTVATSITHLSPLGLSHCIINEKTSYETDKFGIPSPINGAAISEGKIDVVIIPLLAFDNKGARVGYGKGLYDRFLTQCNPNCIKIGVSIFDPIDYISGVNKDDIALDYCATPNKIYTFK
jgi:5-formyltetrahydrofolate cyclo-ligase